MIVSIDDFKSNLSEIDILIEYANANKHTLSKYKLFNKTAVVLLCSHFEVFIESFIAEHIDLIKACYSSIDMPQYMKDNYINDTIRAYRDDPQPSKRQEPLKALTRLLGDSNLELSELGDLVLNVKFSFGKHGQKEVDRLFVKFGLEDFVVTDIYKNAFRDINSVISIRNNIIHEGSAPTLSHEDVIRYKSGILKFAEELEHHIVNNQLGYYGKIIYA